LKPTIFDIETTAIDNFRTLQGLTAIHCLVIRQGKNTVSFTGDDIVDGLKFLREQDLIVGHNILGFDIPAIQKLYPGWKPSGLVRDTLIMARLVYPNQKDQDYSLKDYPKQLIGSHSLKAWGYRLGEHKGEYDGGWDTLNDEMITYCEQDTMVTQKLWDKIMATEPAIEALIIEHEFADCLIKQEQNGIGFDIKKASELYAELSGLRNTIRDDLVEVFPPVITTMKTPAYWKTIRDGEVGKYPTKTAAKKAGFKDSEITRGPNKTKEVPFNPDSRQQIARCLIDKYSWKPEVFTPSGQPQVDESILKTMPHREAKLLVDYLTLSKRLGQLGDGKEAWMKLEQNGRIYGRVNPNGTVTGRCTHSKPNVAQVPACHAPYGNSCRSLFTTAPGHQMVGVDASGLELRCLAHYLAKWDGGIYADIIVEGDIHTANQKAAGLPDRNMAKEFIYAFLYGAGPVRLGKVVGGGPAEGKGLEKRFLKKMPALQYLKTGLENTLKKRDYLVGLDGRRIPIRSSHSALNALLQCAGAVLMKQATIQARKLHRMDGVEANQVAHIHDEIQYEVMEQDSERVGELTVKAIRQAGKPFGFRCPLDGEYKVGRTWAETH